MINNRIIVFSLLIINCLTSVFTIIGMEQFHQITISKYPQLQLELPKQKEKTLPTINGEMYIKEKTGGWARATYVHFPDKIDLKTIDVAGIQVSFNDPCIPVRVKVNGIDWNWRNGFEVDIQVHGKETISVKQFPISVPAKYLWSLTTESQLDLTIHGYPTKLICKKNPLINDKEFDQQFEEKMKILYEKPTYGIAAHPENELVKQLISAKIIIETKIDWSTYFYTFGENGYPDEQHFAKSIAKEKIKPYNNSFYRLAMNQQYGPKTGIVINKTPK